MGEFELIDSWRARFAQHAPNARLPVGPGDDCAVVSCPTGAYLYAADMLLEGVHFDLQREPAHLVGRKALAVNLSDIAAMAGKPEAALISLALPRKGGHSLGDEVMRGILELAEECGVAIAGGDTNSWDGPLVIHVAITGTPPAQGAVLRSGAKLGDAIAVTGTLGGSLAGRHLRFQPRLIEARTLQAHYGVTAMLDLSDGLGSDLRHILTASGVGARLEKKLIPISEAVRSQAAASSASESELIRRALCDGEDFELCFTLPMAEASRLEREQPFAGEPKVTVIGVVTAEAQLCWSDGSPIVERGYVHQL